MPQISQLASEGLSSREISEKVGVGKTTIALWLHQMQHVRTAPQPRDPAQRIREKIDDYTLMRDGGRKGWQGHTATSAPPTKIYHTTPASNTTPHRFQAFHNSMANPPFARRIPLTSPHGERLTE
ncbi:MAG: hypothetical protein ACLP9L_35690 [Thermoguttaceae bacterium]